MVWPALIAAAGGIAASAMGRSDARRSMDFQQDMSNTAYQRSMADMKKAGLNPMLAYMKGGASTPSGAQAQYKNVGESVASALQLRKQKAEIDNIEANTSLTRTKERAVRPAGELGNTVGETLGEVFEPGTAKNAATSIRKAAITVTKTPTAITNLVMKKISIAKGNHKLTALRKRTLKRKIAKLYGMGYKDPAIIQKILEGKRKP